MAASHTQPRNASMRAAGDVGAPSGCGGFGRIAFTCSGVSVTALRFGCRATTTPRPTAPITTM